MNGKRASLTIKTIIHLVLILILFVSFYFHFEAKLGSRGVRQQIVEKDIALLIDASEPGFSFEVMKQNLNGRIDDVDVRDGRVFVNVDGFVSGKGYPYFSAYDVDVEDEGSKFVVRVK
jgi:hypothetical protein